jgi:hypothetical protein
MRIWTLHPKYLDPRGLVALWREALLAQQVLLGKTRGYTAHPQLVRFRAQPDPAGSIAAYLVSVCDEAVSRGYRFNSEKIFPARPGQKITETDGQLLYEWEHLKAKLRVRHPEQFARLAEVASPEPHPLFVIVPGSVRDWERMKTRTRSLP